MKMAKKQWFGWKSGQCEKKSEMRQPKMMKYVRVFVYMWMKLFSVMGINNLVGVKITRDDVMAAFIRTEMNWNAERERDREKKPNTKKTWTHHSKLLFVLDQFLSAFIHAM